jgi:diamine N-acetyltransferase
VLLAEVGAETFSDTFAADNTPADMAEYLTTAFAPALQARELADPSSAFLIAEAGEQTAGYARVMWTFAPACVPGERPMDIARFYVRTRWIGRGVAAVLMRACVYEAHRSASDVIWLSVWEHNNRARAFYKKWGFTEVGEQSFVLGHDAQRDLVMMRRV